MLCRKINSLKYGRILAIIDEEDEKSYSRRAKEVIFDKNSQLISTLKFKKEVIDVIRLKSKKILFLFINHLILYSLKSLKLVS